MKLSQYTILAFIPFSLIVLGSCTQKQNTQASFQPSISTGNTWWDQFSLKTIHVEANRIVYKNFSELKKSSDFVGIVEPLVDFSDRKHDSSRMPDGSLSDFSTRTEVKVIKVFKGAVKPGRITEIIEPISIIYNGEENVKIAIDEYEALPSKTPSLVFLEKNTFGQLGINNAQDSVYSVKKDKDKKSKNFTDPIRSEIYKGLSEENMLEDE